MFIGETRGRQHGIKRNSERERKNRVCEGEGERDNEIKKEREKVITDRMMIRVKSIRYFMDSCCRVHARIFQLNHISVQYRLK